MKRTLSLILAALLLTSSVMSCADGAAKVTEAVETTKAPETNVHETDSPTPSYDTSLITENGVAKAHIVLMDGASKLEKTAAEGYAKELIRYPYEIFEDWTRFLD